MKTMVKYSISSKILFVLALSAVMSISVLAAQVSDTIPELNNEINLGLTVQQPDEISGSVSTVTGEVLQKSPVSNLNQALHGRLSGLFTQETSSELSEAETDFFVRGLSAARRTAPLIVIDGVMFPYNGIEMLKYHISPSSIESISVLKDASTQAIFGSQGANGVISVNTKRGEQGVFNINSRIEQSFQEVTTKPAFLSSPVYAQLRNQAAYNDGLGQHYFFDQNAMNNFHVADSSLYPNNNWYDYFMRDYALMQRADVSVSGGSENVLYFTNLSMMHQGSQFNTEQTEYNSNVDNIRVNFRSNVEAKLNEYLETYLFLNGSVTRNRMPGDVGNSTQIYRSLFFMPPTVYGPVTPEILGAETIDPETGEIIPPPIIVKEGSVVTTDQVGSPTYGILNRSGYRNHTSTNIYSHYGLNLDMSFLTEGLKASGMIAFQANYNNQLRTRQNYERWVRTGPMDALQFSRKGADENTPLAYGKSTSYYTHLTYKGSLDYERVFGMHRVTGMAYLFFQNLSRPETVLPWLIPSNRLNSGVTVTYGYNSRYFLKADLGYSGSDKYAKEYRYLATPAISGAWLISNEQFMENLDWVSYLKLKASYGLTGNDQDDMLSRYPYLDDIVYTRDGSYLGYYRFNIIEQSIGNPNIEPEVSVKQNYGIDLGLFNALDISVEIFRERMENMVVMGTALVPQFQGIPLGIYPPVNEGIFENKGYEIVANYTRIVNNDLFFRLGGFVSHAKNTIIRNNETPNAEDYYYRNWEEGYSFGQRFAYLVDYSNGNGFFNSAEELNASALNYSFVQPRVGDLIYQDLNGDGIIDERDRAPVGTGAIPQFYFGLSGDFRYKGFDLSLLFQGVGKWSTLYNGMGIWETSYDGIFGLLHKNSWTPELYAAGEDITAPALSLNESSNHQNSDYYLYDRSYFRLKNLEIGYTLPERFTNSISVQKFRVFISGQNLLTWDKMKSSDFGPEGNFASIPVYKVFNFGVSLDF